jgi:hypothetical protein
MTATSLIISQHPSTMPEGEEAFEVVESPVSSVQANVIKACERILIPAGYNATLEKSIQDHKDGVRIGTGIARA